jgi:hypothetical protein
MTVCSVIALRNPEAEDGSTRGSEGVFVGRRYNLFCAAKQQRPARAALRGVAQHAFILSLIRSEDSYFENAAR